MPGISVPGDLILLGVVRPGHRSHPGVPAAWATSTLLQVLLLSASLGDLASFCLCEGAHQG